VPAAPWVVAPIPLGVAAVTEDAAVRVKTTSPTPLVAVAPPQVHFNVVVVPVAIVTLVATRLSPPGTSC